MTERRYIRMTATQKGKDDEPTAPVVDYLAGESYVVGPQLFDAFVHQLGCAVEEAPAAELEPEAPGPAPTTQAPPPPAGEPDKPRATKVVTPAATKPARGGRQRAKK